MADSAHVFSKVDDVVVPPNTPRSAAFTVRVMGTRKGQATALPRKFFNGSGMLPVIVPPAVDESSGPRHSHRPSALARHAAGSADAWSVDHCATCDAGVTEWCSEQLMPFEVD